MATLAEGLREIQVAVLDPEGGRAVLEMDWTAVDPDGEGPLAARPEIVRYDAEGLLWLGVAYGLPVLVDLRDARVVVGGQEFRASAVALEALACVGAG